MKFVLFQLEAHHLQKRMDTFEAELAAIEA